MPSERQIHANRENALRSTGPKTEAGKAISSRNSLKHGLLSKDPLVPGEDPGEFRRFQEQVISELTPDGQLQHELADTVVHALWRMRRARQIEVGLLDSYLAHEERAGPANQFALPGDHAPASATFTFYHDLENEEVYELVRPGEKKPEEKAEQDERTTAAAYGRAFRSDASRTSDVFGKLARHEAHLQRIALRALEELASVQRRTARRLND
jgi:hypothetical protein